MYGFGLFELTRCYALVLSAVVLGKKCRFSASGIYRCVYIYIYARTGRFVGINERRRPLVHSDKRRDSGSRFLLAFVALYTGVRARALLFLALALSALFISVTYTARSQLPLPFSTGFFCAPLSLYIYSGTRALFFCSTVDIWL